MKPESKTLFREVQLMRQGSVWWLFIAMSVVALGVVVLLAIKGDLPKQELVLALTILVPVYAIAFYLMYTAQLETEVRVDGVYYRWAPVLRKPLFIKKETIARVEERKSPILQYGFNLFPGYGKVHTVKGRAGFQFYLTTGRKIYIGTQEPFRFRKALESIIQKTKQ